jgi:predicted Zn-dependent protease
MTNATYFNGQVSKGFEAQWTPHNGYWIIQYYDDFYELQTIRWEISDIMAGDSTPQKSTFRYGEFPHQSLLLDTQIAAPHLPEHIQNHTVDSWIQNNGLRGVLMATACLVGLVVSVYWFILPPLAERSAQFMPMTYEKQLGDELFEKLTADYTINEEATTIINEFAQEIDFNTNYDIRIKVVESDVVNAFAVPGGNIVVFTPLLQKMDRPEQLAALLGHEVGHVTHRHSLKSLFRTLSRYMFVSLLTSDLNGVSTTLLDNANTLFNLQYSRELEEEADQTALETLADNHIDQEGCTELFQILKKTTEEEDDLGLEMPAFLSTHPLTDSRIETARSAALQQTNAEKQPNLEAIFARLQKTVVEE